MNSSPNDIEGLTQATQDNAASTPIPTRTIPTLSQATQAIHADDHLNRLSDVAPPLHVSTTFRYASNPADLVPTKDLDHATLDAHIYSRYTAPSTTRLETLLTSLLHAPTLTYTSGLSALHALYIHLNPKRVSIGNGYHGSHGILGIHQKLTGLSLLPLDCPATSLHPGDVIHLETPLNPTGEAYNIAAFAEKAHSRGAYLLVDATFGPPGLQDPFLWGADVVMHAGTKYLGGHSDMLCGVLATHRQDWLRGLLNERTFLGSVMGSLEGWLGVRSLRTLELRVGRQNENAGNLVAWLDACLRRDSDKEQQQGGGGDAVRACVDRVQHASLQASDMPWLQKQMPHGFGPVFALWMRSEDLARRLPSCLRLFQHATSLGGVESLIEWRTMSDESVDGRVMRVSVGVEDWRDLRADLEEAFGVLVAGEKGEEVEGMR
ncbi:hypothetical protein MMC12_000470 [Toensbergia leucococca]|nr:hypothetical protein [Toensbergia leucococca]